MITKQEIKWLNKIVSDKDEELTQIQHKLENQESMIDQYRQQIKVLNNKMTTLKRLISRRSQKVIKHYPTIPKKFSD